MNTRIQLLCAWSGPVFLITYVLAFWQLAGYLPPHPPSMSAIDVAMFYSEHHNQIRAGQILCLISSTLLFPWFAVISAQMARAEGRFPVLAIMQFGGGVLLVVFFAICSMLWIVATYRPDLDPNLIRLVHEAGWLIFVMVFPAYTLQLICIGLSGLIDQSETPWLPRWASYLNFWVGVGGCGGGAAVFFKGGPFAWNGLIGFWLPVLLFAIWLSVMAPLLMKAIRRNALMDARL